jgi:multidrug efflux pump subunit AcrA (membrane-fusion protein)
MDTKKKNAIYVGVAVLAAVLFLWYFLREAPVSVETAVSKRGPMRVTIDGEGKTRVREKHIVTAPIAGKMSRIRLAEGDTIPHDYEITVIDPNPPLQRSPDNYDDRPSIYGAKVYAPAAGKVLRIYEKSARIVAAGAPLVEIGDPNNIEIVVDILSTEALMIPPGARMIIDNQNTGEPIKARVRLIESQAITKVSALGVEEQRVNVVGDLLTKGLRFGDNFRVDLRIVVWEASDVLMIPASAIFRSGEEWNAFVVVSGKARRRAVKVGHLSSEFAEVLDGIEEGERIVLHPPNQLVDGGAVSVQ